MSLTAAVETSRRPTRLRLFDDKAKVSMP